MKSNQSNSQRPIFEMIRPLTTKSLVELLATEAWTRSHAAQHWATFATASAELAKSPSSETWGKVDDAVVAFECEAVQIGARIGFAVAALLTENPNLRLGSDYEVLVRAAMKRAGIEPASIAEEQQYAAQTDEADAERERVLSA